MDKNCRVIHKKDHLHLDDIDLFRLFTRIETLPLGITDDVREATGKLSNPDATCDAKSQTLQHLRESML